MKAPKEYEDGFHDGYLHGLEIAQIEVSYKRDKEKIQKVIDWTKKMAERDKKAGEQEWLNIIQARAYLEFTQAR